MEQRVGGGGRSSERRDSCRHDAVPWGPEKLIGNEYLWNKKMTRSHVDILETHFVLVFRAKMSSKNETKITIHKKTFCQQKNCAWLTMEYSTSVGGGHWYITFSLLLQCWMLHDAQYSGSRIFCGRIMLSNGSISSCSQRTVHKVLMVVITGSMPIHRAPG